MIPNPVTKAASDPSDETCSIVRKCSNVGRECGAEDRACNDKARSEGLEVACDRFGMAGEVFVYCPPGAAARDSNVVWILLAVAVLIAAFGSALAYVVLRKKT